MAMNSKKLAKILVDGICDPSSRTVSLVMVEHFAEMALSKQNPLILDGEPYTTKEQVVEKLKQLLGLHIKSNKGA